MRGYIKFMLRSSLLARKKTLTKKSSQLRIMKGAQMSLTTDENLEKK